MGPHLRSLPPKDAFSLACLPAIGQAHVLALLPDDPGELGAGLARLGAQLGRVQDFYDAIGGLPGYQLQCLQLLAGQADAAAEPPPPLDYLVPAGLDVTAPAQREEVAAATAAGLAALPFMAEIYPLGGAGDRLGLCCEQTGESLPTAVLRYCGRSLLENLVRDLQVRVRGAPCGGWGGGARQGARACMTHGVMSPPRRAPCQAREYLYWKVHGVQHTTPLALMTSAAKGNHWRVRQLLEAGGWYGRGRDAYRLFQQPLVPVVAAADGGWLLTDYFEVGAHCGARGQSKARAA